MNMDYAQMYKNKIVVHPDALYGDGYFYKGNWSRIYLQPSNSKYLDTRTPIDEHYVTLGFEKEWTFHNAIALSKLSDAVMIDVPESFDSVTEYLAWLDENNFKLEESDKKWILHCVPNLEHKVMRNYNGVHVFPGAYGIVGKANWPAKMLDGGTHQHAVRYYNGKRTYQTFCGSSFNEEQEALYQVLSTIPDLTEREMHDFGIEDFG